MEVYGNIRQKVIVDPLDVIDELLDQVIGKEDYIVTENNRYYINVEESAGQHSFYDKREISKEVYDYIMSLSLIRYTLNNEVKNNKKIK